MGGAGRLERRGLEEAPARARHQQTTTPPAPHAAGGHEEATMIDEPRIRDWLAAYHHAWTTDDPKEIAALFTGDVRYFTAPYRAPLEGSRP